MVEEDESIEVQLEVVGVDTETEALGDSNSVGSKFNVFISTPTMNINEISSTSRVSRSTALRHQRATLSSVSPYAEVNDNPSTGDSSAQHTNSQKPKP